MEIKKLKINNFRGIKTADIIMNGNCVFVGDNNSGKSTIFEALDLVMGPDRLARHPVINEHDFYAGEYIKNGAPQEINIEATISGLNEEQLRHFVNYIEWLDTESLSLIEEPPAETTDSDTVIPVLRVTFIGGYDIEEDDFWGQTFFSSSLREGAHEEFFKAKEKRKCGFLYLRTLRTGNRALSLEKGSLLDIILQLKEIRPQMWENVISQLKDVSVASDPALGIGEILLEVQKSLSSLVSYETADKPQIRVSNFTREHLRKVLTVFMGSGALCEDGTEYATPYHHQGTGTINTLVLSLLSMIADIKENVIFAMEEPEIALPPHIQKRIVLNVIDQSTQALFTSHSPYVLEEFDTDKVMVVSRENGVMKVVPAGMPPAVKEKAYQEEFRKRFCESLLARRVLIAEGRTEVDVYSAAARKLQKLHPDKSLSFELLGISIVNASTDSQIVSLGNYYHQMNKKVYAIFDKQDGDTHDKIINAVDYAYEATEHGIENVVLKGISYQVLLKYGEKLVSEKEWPTHLSDHTPNGSMNEEELRQALFRYFKWGKGNGSLANLVMFCDEKDMPVFIKETIYNISTTVTGCEDFSEPNEETTLDTESVE